MTGCLIWCDAEWLLYQWNPFFWKVFLSVVEEEIRPFQSHLKPITFSFPRAVSLFPTITLCLTLNVQNNNTRDTHAQIWLERQRSMMAPPLKTRPISREEMQKMKTMLGKGVFGVFLIQPKSSCSYTSKSKSEGCYSDFMQKVYGHFGLYFFMTSYFHASTIIIIIRMSVSSVSQYICKTPCVGFLLCLILFFLVFYSS